MRACGRSTGWERGGRCRPGGRRCHAQGIIPCSRGRTWHRSSARARAGRRRALRRGARAAQGRGTVIRQLRAREAAGRRGEHGDARQRGLVGLGEEGDVQVRAERRDLQQTVGLPAACRVMFSFWLQVATLMAEGIHAGQCPSWAKLHIIMGVLTDLPLL